MSTAVLAPPGMPDSTTPQRPLPPQRAQTSKFHGIFHRHTPSESKRQRAASNEDLALDPHAKEPPAERIFRNPFSRSANNSPDNSLSTTPASTGSPSETIHSTEQEWISPPSGDLSGSPPKRASTGLALGSLKFMNQSPPSRGSSDQPFKLFQSKNSISRPAAEGAGLKARRMSTALPDDFFVDVIELHDEYSSTSKLPGRRGKQVGKGATATVKLMYRKGHPSDVVYAVKEFRKMSSAEDKTEYEKKVKSEYTIAKSLRHPNIVESFRLCTHSGRWNHVMEYCPYELYQCVEKKYMEKVDQDCLFKQLCRGVAYLHANGIAHRDIKLENLLMTSGGQLKITDFGVSDVFCGEHPGLRESGGQCGKNMKEIRKCAPGICGSLPYIAPEVIAKEGEYDPRPIDVWSCAIVYLTMIYGGGLWPELDAKHDNYHKFKRGWDSWLASHDDDNKFLTSDNDNLPKCGPAFGQLKNYAQKRLILRMLHPLPAYRTSMEDVLKDNYFKSIESCSAEDYGEVDLKIDSCAKKSCKIASKMIRRKHNHLPPASKTLPSIHTFQIGEG